MHITLYAKNRKLHKFATTNSNFKKLDYLRHASSYSVHVYDYINLQLNRVSRSDNPCTQTDLQKIVSCINLQLAIRILKNHAFRICTTP